MTRSTAVYTHTHTHAHILSLMDTFPGDMVEAGKNFANAINVVEKPIELFMYLQQTFPPELFELIAMHVDPEVMKDKYFDNLSTKIPMVEIKV